MSVVVVFGRFLNRFTICLEMQKVNSSSSSSNRQQTQSNRILPLTNFDSSSAKRREAFEAKHANAECCCCTVRLVPWLALGWLAGWLAVWMACWPVSSRSRRCQRTRENRRHCGSIAGKSYGSRVRTVRFDAIKILAKLRTCHLLLVHAGLQ